MRKCARARSGAHGVRPRRWTLQRELVDAAQAGLDSGPAAAGGASAHHHAGPQRARGESAGERGRAAARPASRFIRPTAAATSPITGRGNWSGYPILDLREWKRDVGAYVRAIEQVMIDTLADFGIARGTHRGLHRRLGGWERRSRPSECTSAAGSHRTGSR